MQKPYIQMYNNCDSWLVSRESRLKKFIFKRIIMGHDSLITTHGDEYYVQ